MSVWYLYSREVLPKNFNYPKSFLEFGRQDKIPDLEPWWFLCKFKSNADFWFEELKKLYPERSLIPFAKLEDSDDLACFDGSDSSNDPKVFFIHVYASSGWEERGYVTNFTEWINAAKEESARYKSERAED